MNSHKFVFPPPPPPPPPATSSGFQGYAQPVYSQNHSYGGRGNRGDGRGRGRGRGEGYRGSRGGPRGGLGHGGYGSQNNGYNNPVNSSSSGGYPLPDYPPPLQYPVGVQNSYGYPPSKYAPAAPSSRPPYQDYSTNGPGRMQHYGPAVQPGSYPYNQDSHQTPPAAYRGHSHSSHPRHNEKIQPVLMGPPIRMGFDSQNIGEYGRSQAEPLPYTQTATSPIPDISGPYIEHRPPYRQSSPGTLRPNRYNSPNPFQTQRGRGQKRLHSEAFKHQRNRSTASIAPPAVPSFNNALPSKPPAAQDSGKKSRKKKRRHNQLGLTPKTEEHESSEEEDVDEEAKLAAAAGRSGLAPQPLEVTFNGKTSTLESEVEIAAWIAERKKRFPTKARAEEAAKRKLQIQEEQRLAKQLRKAEQQKRQREAEQKKKAGEADAAAAKAKAKAEKLRRRLEKVERRLAKEEAKTIKTKPDITSRKETITSALNSQQVAIKLELGSEDQQTKTESTTTKQPENEKCIKEESKPGSASCLDQTTAHEINVNSTNGEDPALGPRAVADPLTPMSQVSPDHEGYLSRNSTPAASDQLEKSEPQPNHIAQVPPEIEGTINETDETMSTSSSDISSSEEEDSTSSSGTSSDGDKPEETRSKRDKPEKVPLQNPTKSNSICRAFLNSGRCNRGSHCRFRHELPERGSGSKNAEKAARRRENKKEESGKKERMSLHQRLVAQEKEKEDMMVLQQIVLLGQQGLLDKGNEEIKVEGEEMNGFPKELNDVVSDRKELVAQTDGHPADQDDSKIEGSDLACEAKGFGQQADPSLDKDDTLETNSIIQTEEPLLDAEQRTATPEL